VRLISIFAALSKGSMETRAGVDAGSEDLESSFPPTELSNHQMAFPLRLHGECRRKVPLDMRSWACISKSVHNSGPFRSRPQFVATMAAASLALRRGSPSTNY